MNPIIVSRGVRVARVMRRFEDRLQLNLKAKPPVNEKARGDAMGDSMRVEQRSRASIH
jgi:hypothetical protein